MTTYTTLYYDNGNMKYCGNILNGKYHGFGTLYYDIDEINIRKEFKKKHIHESRGIMVDRKTFGIRYRGYFKNGKCNGHGELYYKNGVLKTKGEFKNSKYKGFHITYDIDTRINDICNCVDKGKLHGLKIEYGYNSRKRAIFNCMQSKKLYINGKYTGNRSCYTYLSCHNYTNDKVYLSKNIFTINNKTTITKYYPNGNIKFHGTTDYSKEYGVNDYGIKGTRYRIDGTKIGFTIKNINSASSELYDKIKSGIGYIGNKMTKTKLKVD